MPCTPSTPPLPSPWRALHGVVALGLVLRLTVALRSDFVYHPDEIFQYLEQAHRLVFGYGYLPWEYRYGIRSWILPGFLTLVLQGGRWLHLDTPDRYIPLMKGLGCLLSLSLIYGAYWIGRCQHSELAGRLASLVVCLWPGLIVFAPKLTPEVLATYSLVVALACLVLPPTPGRAIALGLFSALTGALRLQFLPAVLVLALATLVGWRRQRLALFLAAAAFALGIGLAGWLDYWSWGRWFASSWNNYLYNQVYGISSVWGDSPADYYLRLLAAKSWYLFPGAIALALVRRPRPWLLLLLAVSLVGPHSLIGHKEPRFVLAAVPLLAILVGLVWGEGVVLWGAWTGRRRWCCRAALMAPTALLLVLCWQGVWRDTAGLVDKGILTAYRYLYHQPSLAGLLNLYTPWYGTGGYYYLHRDVPIYTADHLATIPPPEYRRYASHLVCPVGAEPIPGFVPIAQFEDVEVRQLQMFANQYEALAVEPRSPLQPEVDEVYTPTVSRRW